MTRKPKKPEAAPIEDAALDAASGGIIEIGDIHVSSYQNGGLAGRAPAQQMSNISKMLHDTAMA